MGTAGDHGRANVTREIDASARGAGSGLDE
jgi:hypothetical protein